MNELIIPNKDIKEMAQAMGPLFQKRPEDMFALMLLAQAEGKHPAIAAQEYDIIQGRPALRSQSAQARFQIAGGKVIWKTRTDTEASATFSHPQGGELTITWTIDRAKNAGLTGKDNWKKYPAQMLSARVVSEGVRAVFPACLSGMYLPEEIEDIHHDQPAEPRNVTPEAVEVQGTVSDAAPDFQKQYLDAGKMIAAIVSTEANGGWTEKQKADLDLRGLLKAAKDSQDAAMALVAVRRAEIANQYRTDPAWTQVVADIVSKGMDLEALDMMKAGLSA
jgi:hypothetical protein